MSDERKIKIKGYLEMLADENLSSFMVATIAKDALELINEYESMLKEWETYAPYLAVHGLLHMEV